MFQDACKHLLKVVPSILIVHRNGDGTTGGGVGAGIIVNSDGWILTAGHIMKEIADLDAQVRSQKNRRKPRSDRATDYAYLIGKNAYIFKPMLFNENLDIGAAKMMGFKPAKGIVYPRFRKGRVEIGEMLCRVGYPLLPGTAIDWTDRANLRLPKNLFPIPAFANEAFVSRFQSINGKTAWFETSSPGLIGQSGGPLIDTEGNICGMQVSTTHYPLGFSGKGSNQVLNVGRVVIVDVLKEFLSDNNISFS